MRTIFKIRKYYDGLSRLKGKQYYNNDTCPTYNQTNMNMLYWYDDYSDAIIIGGDVGATTDRIRTRDGSWVEWSETQPAALFILCILYILLRIFHFMGIKT